MSVQSKKGVEGCAYNMYVGDFEGQDSKEIYREEFSHLTLYPSISCSFFLQEIYLFYNFQKLQNMCESK